MLASRMASEPAQDTLQWEDVPCPCCRLDSGEVVLEAPDPNSPRGLIFPVVRCRGCGLHYTNPRPVSVHLDRFYPSDYKPHRQSGKPFRKASRFAWLTGNGCPERRGHVGMKPGRLLDFGCGGGSFLKRMADLGWTVTGLDSSLDAVNRVQNDLGLNAYLGTLPHRVFKPSSFDLITMWHSLEHVPDPQATLEQAFDLLVPGGRLLVAVPNIRSAAAKFFGPAWFGLDLPRHLTHFCKASLQDMLALSGFRTRSIRGVKHSDWIRRSAQLAVGSNVSIKPVLKWKPFAKLFAWMTYITGTCDCILATAERPR